VATGGLQRRLADFKRWLRSAATLSVAPTVLISADQSKLPSNYKFLHSLNI
jgi:hypothetical protein